MASAKHVWYILEVWGGVSRAETLFIGHGTKPLKLKVLLLFCVTDGRKNRPT